jgi:hypothetical protein
MTQEEALNFLKEYQPMPKDEDLSEELIRKYDEVRQFFLKIVIKSVFHYS